MTKFDTAFRRDRLVYQHKVSQMQSQINDLERRLAIEENRRLTEGIRSISEGPLSLIFEY